MPRPVRVAVIGPGDMVDQAVAVAGRIPGVRVLPMPYEHEGQASELYRQCSGQAEVALFTGPLAYQKTASERQAGIPALYIPYSAMWLYASLFRVDDREALTRVSVDTMDRQVVEETYRELGIPLRDIYVYEYSGLPDPEQVVEFHLGLHREGRTTHALTCLRRVYGRLRTLGVPAAWLVPSRVAVAEALEKAVLVGEGMRARGMQLVVGLAKTHSQEEALTPLQQQRARLRAYSILLGFAEEIDGHLWHDGGDEYQFVTTRTLFEKSTNFYTSWDLVERFNRAGVRVSVGVGFGETANRAGANARLALQEAIKAGGNRGYVMTEHGRLIGPLGAGAVGYDVRSTDPALLDRARELGMAPASLSRALALLADLGEEFTAREAAARLQVAVRSANRILGKLEAGGLVERVGQEAPGRRGRPRRVYRLSAAPTGPGARWGEGLGGNGPREGRAGFSGRERRGRCG